MFGKLSARTKWVCKVTLAIALFVGIATTVGWREIQSVLSQADLRFIVAAWVISLVGRATQAAQMAMVMRRIGTPVRIWKVLFANSQATLYGLVIPGDVASSVVKWTHLSEFTGKRSLVLNAIVYNRLMLLAPWPLTAVAAVSIRNPWNHHWLPYIGVGTSVIVCAAFMVFYHPRFGPPIDRVCLAVSRKLLFRPMHRRVEYVFGSLQPFRRSAWTSHLLTLGCGFLNLSISLTVQLTMAASVGIHLGWLDYVWIATIQKCLRQLPISFHGIGINQASLILLLGQYEIPSQLALSFGILGLTAVIVFALIGLVWQLLLLFQAKRANKLVRPHFPTE